ASSDVGRFARHHRHGRAIPGGRTRYHDSVFRPLSRDRLRLRRPPFECRDYPRPEQADPGGPSRIVPKIQVRMDLHVYRNSQDRWHDLRSVARECGAVLALNAVTLEELVERLTPDLKAATAGQRLAVTAAILKRCERTDRAGRLPSFPNLTRYAYHAID